MTATPSGEYTDKFKPNRSRDTTVVYNWNDHNRYGMYLIFLCPTRNQGVPSMWDSFQHHLKLEKMWKKEQHGAHEMHWPKKIDSVWQNIPMVLDFLYMYRNVYHSGILVKNATTLRGPEKPMHIFHHQHWSLWMRWWEKDSSQHLGKKNVWHSTNMLTQR